MVALAKRFGARTAVEGLTFRVRPGEVFGLLGPNGAGKTTTVRMLTGLLTPSEGDAYVGGVSVRTGGEALRGRVGLLTEQPGLYDRLTARENLLFYLRLNGVDRKTGWARAERYLERFGLAGREGEPCGSFSKGMRQKLAIIRALLHDPEVIFLDEPTSGLDPESARTVRDAVAELATEGRTLVLCSHNLAEVERLCQRVAVVKNRLLALATVTELKRQGVSLELKLDGDAAKWREGLAALPFAVVLSAEARLLRVRLESEEQTPALVAHLVGQGARVYQVVPAERPLEEVYLKLVREEAA